jgi:hypothetical protein
MKASMYQRTPGGKDARIEVRFEGGPAAVLTSEWLH